MESPRDIVRVMQGNSRNPFVQAKGCAHFRKWHHFQCERGIRDMKVCSLLNVVQKLHQ